MAHIYEIQNIITGDTYIGKTILSPEKRFQKHCYNSTYGTDTHLCRAIRKYGIPNFRIRSLEEVSKDQLNIREMYYIKVYQPRYNMTPGGDGGNTHVFLKEETRKKLSLMNSGSGNPMFGKLGIDNPNYGKKHGPKPETGRKLKNPCICEGDYFESIGDAEKFYHGKYCVRKRLDNPKYTDWYRLVPKTNRK